MKTKERVKKYLGNEFVLSIAFIKRHKLHLNDDISHFIEMENPDYSDDTLIHFFMNKENDWCLYWFLENDGFFYIEFDYTAISNGNYDDFIEDFLNLLSKEGEISYE